MSETIKGKVGNLLNPKNGVAIGAVLLALTGCSTNGGSNADSERTTAQSIAAAHNAGFANARVRDDGTSTGPNDIFVQYGACWLEAEVSLQGDVAIQDVNTNLQFNTGAARANQTSRVDDILASGVTHTELDHLTKAGLTGLNGCLILAPRIETILDK